MNKLILFFLVLGITSFNLMALDITVEDAEGLIHDVLNRILRLPNHQQERLKLNVHTYLL